MKEMSQHPYQQDYNQIKEEKEDVKHAMAQQKMQNAMMKEQNMHHRASYAGQQRAQSAHRKGIQGQVSKMEAPTQVESPEFKKKEAVIANTVGSYVPMGAAPLGKVIP